MLQLQDSKSSPVNPFLSLGFRPFFLMAAGFACVSMMIWMLVYLGGIELITPNIPTTLWHGHEMVFGYSLAVIAGFLLTATRNWTNQTPLQGWALGGLVILWLIARISPLTSLTYNIWIMAISDLLFMAILIIAIALPIIRTKQWQQLPIVSKLLLMMACNALFYLGLLQLTSAATLYWGLYGGFYLVISLIMMMGRRVIPFFIEKGVDEDIKLTNWKWLDISSLVLFLCFIVAKVFVQNPQYSSLIAAALFVLHTIRLIHWYAPGIWSKPLLWVLYVGYSFIVMGFGLEAIGIWLELSPWLSIHAFGAGGIGLITIGMMSRVSLGHTGRSIFDPHPFLFIVFLLLALGAVFRVILPLVLPELYSGLVGLAQVYWILGFALFIWIYAPILTSKEADGRLK